MVWNERRTNISHSGNAGNPLIIGKEKTCPNNKMAVVCKKCGLPDDLCACGELDKEETRIVVRLETRRFSKTTTMIEGIDPKMSDLHHIAKELKSKLACGGTSKAGFIMLQGDHRDDVKDYLIRLGFTESAIEVQ